MNAEPLRSKVIIVNAQGLHVRPMKDFVELASKFQSSVSVCKQDEPPVDGKSAWGLLTLAAEQGTELTLEVSGPDQQEALEALVTFLKELIKEDEPGHNSP